MQTLIPIPTSLHERLREESEMLESLVYRCSRVCVSVCVCACVLYDPRTFVIV